MTHPCQLLTQPEIDELVEAYKLRESHPYDSGRRCPGCGADCDPRSCTNPPIDPDTGETLPAPPHPGALQFEAFGSLRTNQAAMAAALFGVVS